MTREKILADDMNEALREVKDRFGSDAYILETRTVRERIPGTMNSNKMVELTVSLAAPPKVDRKELPPLHLGKDGRFIDEAPSLESELERLDTLLGELEVHEERLEDLDQHAYPLAKELRDWGLFNSTVHRLTQDFEQEVPTVDQQNPQIALDRLSSTLRFVGKMKVNELRGIHALTGPAGSGKTSLALKLADRVSGSGARVALLAYGPRHAGEVARLEEASRRLGVEVALAEDENTLVGAIRHLLSRDLILLDMPPLEDAQWDLLEKVEDALHREPVFRHLVVAADAGWRDMEGAAGAADFLAITRADRDAALRPALDLLPLGEFNLGFVSSGAETESSLEMADAENMVRPLEQRVLRRQAMSG
jgi:flagellar biosynthesis GTPase FlhF